MENSPVSSELTCIARVYSPSQAALKLSLLEAAGFNVFLPGFHILAMMQHWSVAIGGVQVLVPRPQAGEATALLLACELADEAARADPPAPRSAPRNLFWRVLFGIVFWISGPFAPALNISFLNRDKAAG